MRTSFARWLLLLGAIAVAVVLLIASGCVSSAGIGTELPTTPVPTITTVPVISIIAESTAVSTPVASDIVTPSVTPTTSPVFTGVPGAIGPLTAEELARAVREANSLPVRPPLFERRLLVGLYGTPAGRGLGILGRVSATETVSLAVQQVLAYQELLTDTDVIPFFHMVTTIADAFPGSDGNYSHRVSTMTLQLWLDVASTYGLWSVVDIQPGHSTITAELAYVAPFVQQHHVHLAVDPEFMVAPGAIPGNRIGVMSGETLNLVQAWLQQVASATGERKMLVIHQFDNRMFVNKAAIEDYPLVELVWDADGFGGPGAKISDYRQYAAEPGFEYGGFKLFYNYDVPLMAPADVLRLEPFPVFVVYQ